MCDHKIAVAINREDCTIECAVCEKVLARYEKTGNKEAEEKMIKKLLTIVSK